MDPDFTCNSIFYDHTYNSSDYAKINDSKKTSILQKESASKIPSVNKKIQPSDRRHA